MKKRRNLILSFMLAAVCVACLTVALASCGGSGNDSASYGYGEQGVYYYSAGEYEEYTLTMQSGAYMMTLGGEITSSGTYAADADSGEIEFKGTGASFTATLLGDRLSLSYDGGTYVFHRRVYYTVEYVGAGVSETREVLSGKAAEEIDGERDGYIFLGWYTDETYTTPYVFTEEISGDTVIYGRYEARDYSAAEYVVTFDYGDGVTETQATQNGRIYGYVLPETDGSWWVSATNSAGELTYRYDEDVLREDTTFFAVPDDETALGVSVYADRVTWDAAAANTTVTIMSDGEPVDTRSAGGATSYAYDFESLPAGKYTVRVSNSNGAEERTYVSRALARVSGFEVVSPQFLVYGGAEGAEKYIIKIEDANSTYYIDNGTRLTYDFSSYEMGREGIKFTVFAVADGMYHSESAKFVYTRFLDTPEVSSDGDTIVWDETKYAAYYEVYVDGELVATSEGASYSAIYMDAGTYTVQVRPVLEGYYSQKSAEYVYVKTTVAAPTITKVEDGVIYWDAVKDATGYVISIGDETYSTDATAFATSAANLPEDAEEVSVRVKALGDESSRYCDTVYITKSEMGYALTYEDGVIYWQYSLAAEKYVVQVNGEDETEVTGVNRLAIELTKYGENGITVYFVDGDGVRSSVAAVGVYAYAVILDARGGEIEGGKDVVYIAAGDRIVLPDAVMENYEFSGWYTLPDLTNFYTDGSIDYSGTGVLVENGTIFGGTGDRVCYAFYTPVSYTVTIYAGDGYFADADGEPVFDADGEYVGSVEFTVYYGRTFSFPAVVPTDSAKSFSGWYGERNGAGTRYTDENGQGLAVWNTSGDVSVYAGFWTLLEFSLTTYEGRRIAAVSAGADIDNVSEVTVPEKCVIDGTTYSVEYVGSVAFNSCQSLEVVNLPDTIVCLQTVNNGYSSGSGAFSLCSGIKEVNVYATGDGENTSHEITYYSEDGVLYEKDGDGVSLIYYPRVRSGAFVVPETVCNENEYEIGVNGSLNKVYRDVVAISSQVFSNNTKLTSIVIPYTVTKVESQAFYGATALVTVVFEDDGEDNPLTVSENVFEGCTSLFSVMFPARLVSLEISAFTDCPSLTEINVSGYGGTYTSKEGYLCDSTGTRIIYAPHGITEFDISDRSVTGISEGAFEGCEKLETVVINGTIQYIGKDAFRNCTALTSLTFQGGADSVSLEIAEGAFYGCEKLTEVILPPNLAYLGTGAFGGCKELETVRVEIVGEDFVFEDGAFASTSGALYVTTVKIGAACGYVDITSVFGQGVASATVEAGNPYYFVHEPYGVIYDVDLTHVSYLPRGLTYYETPESLTTIEAYMFQNRTELQEIAIKPCESLIKEGAFYGCTGLTAVTFGTSDGTTIEAGDLEIEAYAFYGCRSLKTISMPDRLSVIGKGAFSGCTSLQSFTITKNVRQVGDEDHAIDVRDVFYNCSSLAVIELDAGNENFVSVDGVIYNTARTQLFYSPRDYSGDNGKVTILGSVVKIWYYSFEGNTAMTELAFSDETNMERVEIGEYAFANCTSLSKITLLEGLSTLTEGMFSGCTSLTGVTIPTSVTEMEINVFKGDKKLETVVFTERGADPVPLTLAEGVSSSSSVFAGLSALTSISLPEGTESIPRYTFNGCTSLSYVHIPSTVVSIGANAFDFYDSSLYKNSVYDYGKLTRITIDVEDDANLASIGENAFYGAYLDELDLTSTKLESVGKDSFRYCASDFVRFPVTLGEVEAYSFEYCYIKDIEVNGAENVYNYAFSNSAVESVTLGNLKSTSLYAFYKCTSLTEVNITACAADDDPSYEGLTLGGNTFYGCTSLTEIVLPEGTRSIGYNCFYNDSLLTGIEIPASVESVGESCFYNCSSLKSVDFDTYSDGYASLRNIDGTAFGNSGIEEFRFPASYSAIELGDRIFYGCNSLTYLFLSESVTSLEPIIAGGGQLKKIDVSEKSEVYSAVDGVPIVFNKEKTSICWVYGFADDFDGRLDLSDDSETGTGTALVEIGGNAFQGCTEIVEIVLPGTLMAIGVSAFQGCTNLSAVTNAENTQIAKIDDYAFYNCSKLSDITLPSTVTEIGSYAFYGCGALTQINIENAVTIGVYAFSSSGLTSVTLAEGITALGSDTTEDAHQFYNCKSLAYVELPSTLSVIGVSVFAGCSSLTSIDLKNVETIGGGSGSSGPFYNCGLVEITIPSSVSAIRTYAFQGCSKLTTVVFEPDCLAMGSYMFYDCTALTSVTLPTNVLLDAIPENAFYGCSSLAYIELPSNVKTLGNSSFRNTGLASIDLRYIENFGTYLFAGCVSLTSVIWPSASLSGSYDLTDELENANYMFSGCSFAAIGLPDTVTSLPTYFFQNNTKLEQVTIPEEVATVPSYMCYGCTSLSTVIFVGEVGEIADYAFYNCSSLTFVEDTHDLTDIGAYAFYGCALLKTLDTSSVTYMGYNAFYGCSSVDGLDLSSVASFGGSYVFYNCASLTEADLSGVKLSDSYTYLFYGCTSLEKVVLSDDTTCLPNSMFYNCKSLREINIPLSLTTLGNYVFYGSGIEEIAIPSGVTATGTQTFRGCTSLKKVTFEGNVTTITSYLFEGCTALSSVTLPLSVTTIDTYAFQNCSSLETISLPAALVTVGNYAFKDSGLVSLIIPERVETIGTQAFYGCTAMTEIWIGRSVVSVGTNAFYGCTCDMFIVNTASYVQNNWGASWKNNAGFSGTDYYYSSTGSDSTNYWYVDSDGGFVAVRLMRVSKLRDAPYLQNFRPYRRYYLKPIMCRKLL